MSHQLVRRRICSTSTPTCSSVRTSSLLDQPASANVLPRMRHVYSCSHTARQRWQHSQNDCWLVGAIKMNYQNPPRNMRCPHCDHLMSKSPNSTRRLSRDHIFPVEWGGNNTWGDDIEGRNYRWCCQECNSLRASVGHCIGAMATVLIVARHTKQRPILVARGWGLPRIASLIAPPQRPRSTIRRHATF